MLPDCLLMMLFALQGHVPLLNNPPQPEDADIRDEPGASGADEGAPSADASAPAGATGVDESAGVELPGTGDSEDSDPFVSSGRGLQVSMVVMRRVVLFRRQCRQLRRLLL